MKKILFFLFSLLNIMAAENVTSKAPEGFCKGCSGSHTQLFRSWYAESLGGYNPQTIGTGHKSELTVESWEFPPEGQAELQFTSDVAPMYLNAEELNYIMQQTSWAKNQYPAGRTNEGVYVTHNFVKNCTAGSQADDLLINVSTEIKDKQYDILYYINNGCFTDNIYIATYKNETYDGACNWQKNKDGRKQCIPFKQNVIQDCFFYGINTPPTKLNNHSGLKSARVIPTIHYIKKHNHGILSEFTNKDALHYFVLAVFNIAHAKDSSFKPPAKSSGSSYQAAQAKFTKEFANYICSFKNSNKTLFGKLVSKQNSPDFRAKLTSLKPEDVTLDKNYSCPKPKPKPKPAQQQPSNFNTSTGVPNFGYGLMGL